MPQFVIRRATRRNGKALLLLIDALADYEKLVRPSPAARKRLLNDALGSRRRIRVFLAFVDGKAVGYAIYFHTYSSFLALPTLYLEDIFVLKEYRRMKIGLGLFRACVAEAEKEGCGRMEWVVLDWNTSAIDFYKRLGARHLQEWQTYRLEERQFSRILSEAHTD